MRIDACRVQPAGHTDLVECSGDGAQFVHIACLGRYAVRKYSNLKSRDYYRIPVSCTSAHVNTCDSCEALGRLPTLGQGNPSGAVLAQRAQDGEGFGKAEGTVQEREDWDFPGGPGLKTPPSNTGSAVPSLMRELRPHVPQSMARNQ